MANSWLFNEVVLQGTVLAVSSDERHRFSKAPRTSIRLIKDHGVYGDAHAGHFMKHRHLARQQPELPNNRQVHLIHSELFGELDSLNFDVKPGELGENITTSGIELLRLPLGSFLLIGERAVVELTGLRTPCGYIDRFQQGLKRTMIVKTPAGTTFRAGVLGIVRASGSVVPGDSIKVQIPPPPWQQLPAL